MKPSEKYIDWLQAHPAVCDALNEHELECWDFFMWEGDVYVVSAVGCDGVYANKRDRSRDWFNTEEDLAGRSLWLPTLGQLVRMLQHEWEDWANRLEVVMLKETEGNKGAKAMISPREPYLQPIESSEWEWEPEIAATALWAKRKGVESD